MEGQVSMSKKQGCDVSWDDYYDCKKLFGNFNINKHRHLKTKMVTIGDEEHSECGYLYENGFVETLSERVNRENKL